MPGLPLWLLRRRDPEAGAVYTRILAALSAAIGAPLRPGLPGAPRQPEAPPGPLPTPPGGPQPPLPLPPPLPPPTIGGISTRFGRAPLVVSDAIRAAFPERAWVAAAEIAHEESGWRPTAVNDTRARAGGLCGVRYVLPNGVVAQTEYSVGIFQINICAHGGTFAQWSDPDNASAKAVSLWRARGERWTDWYLSATRLGLPV